MHSRHYSEDPRLTGMAHGFLESMNNGRRVLSHGGDTFLFHSGLYLLPDEDVGLYISTNGTGGSSVGDVVWAAFMDRYYPAEAAVAPEPSADFAERIAPYLGSYYMSRRRPDGQQDAAGTIRILARSRNGRSVTRGQRVDNV